MYFIQIKIQKNYNKFNEETSTHCLRNIQSFSRSVWIKNISACEKKNCTIKRNPEHFMKNSRKIVV